MTGIVTCALLPAPAAICMPVNEMACDPIAFAPALPQLAVPMGAQLTPGAAITARSGSVSANETPVAFDGPVLVTVMT